MIKEAQDFRAESDTLAALLADADEKTFRAVTLFKGWTVEDVIAHLHMWNAVAGLSLESREEFQGFFEGVAKAFMGGESHVAVQRRWLDENENGAHGRALFDIWRDYYPRLADSYAAANPDARLAWAGPDMSAKNAIIARQMETWAHGQEVFDVLGRDREEKDRIRNICHLGVATYSWTFRNRGEAPPQPKPYVRLTAPSGALWEWNEPQSGNAVIGKAAEFAQVVTQTRNIADTALETNGANAMRWMRLAQCFAGPPEDPPPPGSRRPRRVDD